MPGRTQNSETSLTAVSTLVWMIQDGFNGDPDQSLMGNLRNLKEHEWTLVPAGGERSIAAILEHVGWCKWMCENYAFGDASMQGDQPPLVPENGQLTRPVPELLSWLKQGHHRWLAAVSALQNDAELDRERLTNWGEYLPTRTIVRIMIGHDFYHAGEINHIRALLQRNDNWPYA